jgi:hypothetical protein
MTHTFSTREPDTLHKMTRLLLVFLCTAVGQSLGETEEPPAIVASDVGLELSPGGTSSWKARGYDGGVMEV